MTSSWEEGGGNEPSSGEVTREAGPASIRRPADAALRSLLPSWEARAAVCWLDGPWGRGSRWTGQIRKMGVDGGMKCVKFLVFFFNFIFWLCGIALIALGIYVQIELKHTLVMTSASASGPPIVILAVGVIVFFISFFGCCGALKENYCMVTTFAVLLTLIFLVEIAAAIAGYIYKDEIKTVIDKEIRAEIAVYRNNSEVKNLLDDMQQKYSCCGASNYTDWFNGTTPSNIPSSCCKHNDTGCKQNPTVEKINQEGCVTKIEAWLRKHIIIVAGVALGIAFFELLGIIFACCLMKGIRSGYEVM
ncbi:CD63 antigen [Podarcis raffonei]|uniref:CD63 antigen n=1 Tax=Podarcis raffonei TaxID=65483 RepID=UPI0023293692|nr:CD63 antigen [Podarcis raffonei]